MVELPYDIQRPAWDGDTILPARRRPPLRATRAFFIGVVLAFLVAVGWNLGGQRQPSAPPLARCYPKVQVCAP